MPNSFLSQPQVRVLRILECGDWSPHWTFSPAALISCHRSSLGFTSKAVGRRKKAVPSAVNAIQSFGVFLGFNTHMNILGADAVFIGRACSELRLVFKKRI